MIIPALVLWICYPHCSHAAVGDAVQIPPHYTFRLPSGFKASFTDNFVDSSNIGLDLSNLLASAAQSPFISYDPEFNSILGPYPQLDLVSGPLNRDFALEGGIHVPEMNSVWFTGIGSGDSGHVVRALNLSDNTIYQPVDDDHVLRPNGGTYFKGRVYIAFWGNSTVTGGILAIDVRTGRTETIVNNYFGLHFCSPNDVAWAQRTGPNSTRTRAAMFFTDNDFGYILNETGPNVLPSAVWRFDPDNQTLQPIISRADIPDPNGVAVNRESTKLYVSDTPVSYIQGTGVGRTSGSAAIYVYDMTADLVPVNKRLFGFSRARIPDGIKVDRFGRVWTAEGDGVVVRNECGKTLGVFNDKVLLNSSQSEISNFALFDDRLVVLAEERIWDVKLGQKVL